MTRPRIHIGLLLSEKLLYRASVSQRTSQRDLHIHELTHPHPVLITEHHNTKATPLNMLLIRILTCLVTAMLLTAAGAELFLYNSTILKNATSLSPRCIEAMSASINCDPALLSFASVGYVSSMEPSFLADTLCNPKCVTSLADYRKDVAVSCSTVDAWPGVPATYNGDFVQAYQNQSCLKSTSGGWCNSRSSSRRIGFPHADAMICQISSATSLSSSKARSSKTCPGRSFALPA